MISGFDELNRIQTEEKTVTKSKNRSIPYEKYFGVMHLTEKQKKQRKEFAELLEDDLIMIMLLWGETRRYNITDDKFIIQELKTAYIKAATSLGVPSDEYLSDIALAFALNFVRATTEHIGDEWYTSEDRAKFNAENEANTALNYKEYTEAKGKYRYKTWHTENDTRVRLTHIPLEGETVPFNDLFVVGEALMRFPHDYEYAADYPEELVNCRCSITYSN